MRITATILLMLANITSWLFAQEILWEKKYYFGKELRVINKINTVDKNLLLVASTFYPKSKFFLMIDKLGNLQWKKLFNQESFISPQIIENKDGSFSYFAFKMKSTDILLGLWFFRYNISSLGDSLDFFIDTNNVLICDNIPRFCEFDEQSLIVTILRYLENSLKRAGYILKIDKMDGHTIWEKQLTVEEDSLYFLLSTPAKVKDGFIVPSRYSLDHTVFVLIKIDTSGNEIWRRSIESDFDNKLYNPYIIPLDTSDYYLISQHLTKFLPSIMKIKDHETKEWEMLLQFDNYDDVETEFNPVLLEDKSILLGGYIAKFNKGGVIIDSTVRGFITKISPKGERLWDFVYEKAGYIFHYITPIGNNRYLGLAQYKDSLIVFEFQESSSNVDDKTSPNENLFETSLVKDYLDINVSNDVKNIIVFNQFGQCITNIENPKFSVERLDFKNFACGIYFVVIKQNSNFWVRKVVLIK